MDHPIGGSPWLFVKLHIRHSSLICDHDHISVELENGGRSLRRYRAGEDVTKDLSLVSTADYQEDPAGFHNGSDPHGVSLAGDVVDGGKEALISFNGALGQINAVGCRSKCAVRLIESYVSIVSQSQKLQVNTAQAFDYGLIAGALFGAVRFGSVRHSGVGGVNIDMAEQVVMHKVIIALIIVSRKAAVFVQVDAPYFRKI